MNNLTNRCCIDAYYGIDMSIKNVEDIRPMSAVKHDTFWVEIDMPNDVTPEMLDSKDAKSELDTPIRELNPKVYFRQNGYVKNTPEVQKLWEEKGEKEAFYSIVGGPYNYATDTRIGLIVFGDDYDRYEKLQLKLWQSWDHLPDELSIDWDFDYTPYKAYIDGLKKIIEENHPHTFKKLPVDADALIMDTFATARYHVVPCQDKEGKPIPYATNPDLTFCNSEKYESQYYSIWISLLMEVCNKTGRRHKTYREYLEKLIAEKPKKN